MDWALERRRRLLLRVLFVGALIGFSRGASAANDESYFLGNTAALTAGAVVARGQDGASLWYNPAGLGALERHQIDVSVSVAAVQMRNENAGLRVLLPNGTEDVDLDGQRFTLASPSVVFVRRVGDVSLAAGLFTTRDDEVTARGQARTPQGDPRETFVEVFSSDSRVRYGIAAGAGFEPSKRLRLGASLVLVYDSIDLRSTIGLSATDPTMMSSLAATFTRFDESIRWGIATHVGVQWQPSDAAHIGLTIRSPILLIKEDPDVTTLDSLGVAGPGGASTSASFQDPARPAAKPGLLEPTRIFLGVAHDVGKGWLAVEGDFSHALQSLDVRAEGATGPDYLTDRLATWNLRVGGMFPATNSFAIGAGLFTDRSAQRFPESPEEYRVHYYGATAGVRMTSRVDLAKDERVPDLEFLTYLGARYAFGQGDTRRLELNLSSPAAFTVSNDDRIDAQFHEISFYLGSGFYY